MPIRITQFAVDSAGRAGSTFRYVAAQPSWIARAALYAFLIIIGLPLLLLFLLALFVGIVVFALLAGVNWIMSHIRRLLPRDDGRKNVSVIQRRDPNI